MCSDRARPIEDVRVGDSVLTHTGRFRRVTHVMSREFDGDLLKIEAWGSQPIVCTPEHPIRVCDPNSQTYSWKAAKDIVAGDWLVTPKLDHRTDGFIGEALARVIAWYVAEGNVEGGHLTFSLATDETEFIEELCELLKHLGMEPYTRVQENVCMVCVNNAVLSDFLVGVCGSLAPNKRLPLALLRGHERAVWDTLIKGDGCVHVPLGRGRARPVYCYATVSEGLAQQVQIIGASLGYTGSYTISPASKGQIEGREVECRERYNLHMRHASIIDGRNGNKTRSARHAVLGQVISVGCERYHGKIYNLSVAEDESYVVNGRAVHNCSFEAAIKGAFYAEEMRTMLAEGRIRPIEIEKEVRVHTAWDLGVSDSTAIWFIQCVGRERRLVDYYGGSGVGLDHYAQVLHDKRIKHGWSMATITSRTTSK